jgi:hypothetical protein
VVRHLTDVKNADSLCDVHYSDAFIINKQSEILNMNMSLIALLLMLSQAVFWKTPMEKVTFTDASHARTCGYVSNKNYEDDKDVHIILTRGPEVIAKAGSPNTLVIEITPYIRLPFPRIKRYIEAWGFPRRDPEHGWPEINPVVGWKYVKKCEF